MVNILSAVPSGLFSFFNSSRHLLRFVPGYSHSRLRRSVQRSPVSEDLTRFGSDPRSSALIRGKLLFLAFANCHLLLFYQCHLCESVVRLAFPMSAMGRDVGGGWLSPLPITNPKTKCQFLLEFNLWNHHC